MSQKISVYKKAFILMMMVETQIISNQHNNQVNDSVSEEMETTVQRKGDLSPGRKITFSVLGSSGQVEKMTFE